ncbi:MAG: glycine zipper family protein [Pseudomonadota bacterium]
MKKTVIAIAALAFLSGCAGLSDTEQRALTGTTAGAAGGALIGAIAGNAGLGAAIGAGAGLAGGLITDKVQKDKEAAYRRGFNAGAQSN